MSHNSKKSGFVSLIGKPNVGKSTLVNNMINEKVSIVTNKPQTTRNQIKGIYNDEIHQIIFLDTPGYHSGKKNLSQEMNSISFKSIEGVEIILYLIDSKKRITVEDENIIKQLKKHQDSKLIIVLTKIDLIKKEKLIEIINKVSELMPWYESIIPINGLKLKDGELVIKKIKTLLPIHPPFYNDDLSSDRTNKFFISELIREKSLNLLYQEIPHSIHVEIDKLDDNKKKNLIRVFANIIVEKESQKKIVIGNQGSMIKKISSASRKEIEETFGAKVYIEIFVKVRNNWRDDPLFLKSYEVTK